jgi:hypothetical protein
MVAKRRIAQRIAYICSCCEEGLAFLKEQQKNNCELICLVTASQ